MTIETLATGYGLVEGPRVDGEDRVYFSDARGGGVYRRSPDGRVDTIVPKRRGVGGIALHADGGIVISGRDICHVRDGESLTLFRLEGVPGFNDLFTDREGRILVGSQRFSPFSEGQERVPGELYRIGLEGKGECLYGDVLLTNGIGFSPDGKTLYHSDSQAGHVIVHDVDDQGRLSNRRPLGRCEGGAPDGLAVDESGGVWVALYGAGCVARYTPEGALDARVEVPARQVTSVCFGGRDRRDLYVTTGDHRDDPGLGGCVFRTRVDATGLPAPLARVRAGEPEGDA
ncbi:MAG: SMP-30/gluconolactonase/LRE family protein [Myxococcota bacterium]|nr:SMP-30/gluconolactonase/LRE family protein [Myxococcota bacterium]